VDPSHSGLGPLFTAISRSDTLNASDAYAYVAFDV
jgi:hypothetical protein